LKKEISPAVVAVLIVAVLAVAGFFLWKGTGGGAKAPGEVGNVGPFERGVVKMNPPGAAGSGPGGPGAPQTGGRPAGQ